MEFSCTQTLLKLSVTQNFLYYYFTLISFSLRKFNTLIVGLSTITKQ